MTKDIYGAIIMLMNQKALIIEMLVSFFLISLFVPRLSKAFEIPANVKYFGYYHASTEDLMKQVSALGANINVNGDVALNAKYGMYTIVSVSTLRLTDAGWQQRAAAYKASLGDNWKYVYAFYADEPWGTGATPRISKGDFRTITSNLHTAFPDKKMMVIESWLAVKNQDWLNSYKSYYAYVTDIGFDYYFTRNNSTTEGWALYGAASRLWSRALINSDGSRKNYWVVMDGFGPTATAPRWPAAFANYLRHVSAVNGGTGILTFLWDASKTGWTDTQAVLTPGSSRYNSVYHGHVLNTTAQIDLHVATPSAVISSGATPPPTPNPSDFDQDGVVDFSDYTYLKENFGNPYTIFDLNKLAGSYNK